MLPFKPPVPLSTVTNYIDNQFFVNGCNNADLTTTNEVSFFWGQSNQRTGLSLQCNNAGANNSVQFFTSGFTDGNSTGTEGPFASTVASGFSQWLTETLTITSRTDQTIRATGVLTFRFQPATNVATIPASQILTNVDPLPPPQLVSSTVLIWVLFGGLALITIVYFVFMRKRTPTTVTSTTTGTTSVQETKK